MFGWFRKKPHYSLASAAERELLLTKHSAVFREVDAAFHAYLEISTDNPKWDDGQIEQAMIRRGISAAKAEECVTFGPMAWGRDVVEKHGVTCSPMYRMHSMVDGTERDMPLKNEPVFVWARELIPLYRTPERNEVFQHVAKRSAEVDCINNTLYSGSTEDDLKDCTLRPALVHFRRPLTPGK